MSHIAPQAAPNGAWPHPHHKWIHPGVFGWGLVWFVSLGVLFGGHHVWHPGIRRCESSGQQAWLMKMGGEVGGFIYFFLLILAVINNGLHSIGQPFC